MATTLISEKAAEVLAAFDSAQTSSIWTPVPKRSIFDSTEKVDDLDNISSRFKNWVGSLGALHASDNPRSLEHRLRDAPSIRQRIFQILEELHELLTSVNDPTTPATAVDLKALRELCGDDCDELAGKIDNLETSPEAARTYLLRGLDDAVSRLFKISQLVFRAAANDRWTNSELSKYEKIDPHFDIAHIRQKFQTKAGDHPVAPWLLERLGIVNAKRRQFIMYSREHRTRIRAPSQTNPAPLHTSVDCVPTADCYTGVTRLREQSGMTAISRPTNKYTVASKPLVNLLNQVNDGFDDAASHSTFATKLSDDKEETKLCIPDLKEFSEPGEFFECPYCSTMQSFNGQNGWKAHVFDDIRPFICTFKQCDMLMFVDRKSWWDHEMKKHRRQWPCPLCKLATYLDEESFSDHLQAEHSEAISVDQQHLYLATSSWLPEKLSAKSCPLCDWDAKLRPRNTHVPASSAVMVTSSQFMRHLSRHLEQSALFTLPRIYEDEPDVADSVHAAGGSQSGRLSHTRPSVRWDTPNSRSLASSISEDMPPGSPISEAGTDPFMPHKLHDHDDENQLRPIGRIRGQNEPSNEDAVSVASVESDPVSLIHLFGDSHSPRPLDDNSDHAQNQGDYHPPTSDPNVSLSAMGLAMPRLTRTWRPNLAVLTSEEELHAPERVLRGFTRSPSFEDFHVASPNQAYCDSNEIQPLYQDSEHDSTTRSATYICKVDKCMKTFKRAGERWEHERTHPDAARRPHACNYCPRSFMRSKDLRRHRTALHPQESEPRDHEETQDPRAIVNEFYESKPAQSGSAGEQTEGEPLKQESGILLALPTIPRLDGEEFDALYSGRALNTLQPSELSHLNQLVMMDMLQLPQEMRDTLSGIPPAQAGHILEQMVARHNQSMNPQQQQQPQQKQQMNSQAQAGMSQLHAMQATNLHGNMVDVNGSIIVPHDLIERERTHSAGNRPHMCRYCLTEFKNAKDLSRHEHIHDQRTTRYTCRKRGCGKTYKRAHNRIRHEGAKHAYEELEDLHVALVDKWVAANAQRGSDEKHETIHLRRLGPHG